MYKSIAVFAKEYDKGVFFMEQILMNTPKENVKHLARGHGRFEIELVSGEVYRLFLDTNKARGYRWHKVYVDENLISDEEFMYYRVKAGFLNDFDIEYF
jgi:hypothetical protein